MALSLAILTDYQIIKNFHRVNSVVQRFLGKKCFKVGFKLFIYRTLYCIRKKKHLLEKIV